LSEDILQAKIYKWYYNKFCTKLNNPRHVIFSVPNGGLRTKREAVKLVATGMKAGVSDLIILQPNRTIFVEVKTSTGQQRKEQKDFQQQVELLGFEYIVIRSLEDLISYLE